MDSISKYLSGALGEKTKVNFDFDHFSSIQALPADIADRAAAFIVADQLRKLFMAYSKAINKQRDRDGSLFQKYFRRKSVETVNYLAWLVWYIHRNPVHHNLVSDFRKFKWSSYQSFLTDQPSKLVRQEVFHWLDTCALEFQAFHQTEEANWKALQELILEEKTF